MTTDLRRFLDALSQGLPSPGADAVDDILVIGCGSGDECLALLEMFGNARLAALDTDADLLERAQRLFRRSDSRAIGIHGDAASLAELAPGPYELVVARHPDVDRHPYGWQAALTAAVDHLRLEGLLIATMYSLPEAAFVSRILEPLDTGVLPGAPYSTVPVAMAGNDRYILMYRKAYRDVPSETRQTWNR